jgi:hypothetical protein
MAPIAVNDPTPIAKNIFEDFQRSQSMFPILPIEAERKRQKSYKPEPWTEQ